MIVETIQTFQETSQPTRLFSIEGRQYHAPSWFHALGQHEAETGKRPPRQAVVEVV